MAKAKPHPATLVLMDKGDYTDFDGNSRVIMSEQLDGDNPHRIAVVHVCNGRDDATAERLVSAYNSHDTLVNNIAAVRAQNAELAEVGQRALNVLDNMEDDANWNSQNDYINARHFLRAALAKAGSHA